MHELGEYFTRHACNILWYQIFAALDATPRETIPDEAYNKLLEVGEILAANVSDGYSVRLCTCENGDKYFEYEPPCSYIAPTAKNSRGID